MKTQLIGITGRAGSGKSYFAEKLASRYGYNRIRFADPLKQMFSTLLISVGVPVEQVRVYIEGSLKEEPTAFLCGRTPRHAMQTLGTEWGRDSMDPDFWVRAAQWNIVKTLNLGHRVVVEDVRFENEARMIRALGGKVYCLRTATVGADTHISENGLPSDLVEHYLFNSHLAKRDAALLNVLTGGEMYE